MSKEENVDVETTRAEDAEMQVPVEGEKNASTVLGKFKDVDALTRAYESLQAEFTRRSQRLRSLEKEVENFRKLGGESGAEKLRRTARVRREAAKAFDNFVAEVATPVEEATEPALEEKEPLNAVEGEPLSGKESGEESKNGEAQAVGADEGLKTPREAERSIPAGGGARSFVAESEEGSSEALFRRAFDDEGVRLRIVGEYLASLGKSGAPLTSRGAGIAVTPPVKAKTVGQAGDMALLYFRKTCE